jgi:hypothetical protein
MKCMPILEEMHVPPTIVATWSCTSDRKRMSTTPIHHVHATVSDRVAATRSCYTKVTKFPTIRSITQAPLEKNANLSQPGD